MTGELPEGTRILGHAIGHAAFLYGDRIDDYTGILSTALHGRHRAPATARTGPSGYATGRARELIAQAESGALDRNPRDVSRWIGAATEIMRELTRDA